MKEITSSEPIAVTKSGGVQCEQLEYCVRRHAQSLIQRIPDDEVEEVLGREESELRSNCGFRFRRGISL